MSATPVFIAYQLLSRTDTPAYAIGVNAADIPLKAQYAKIDMFGNIDLVLNAHHKIRLKKVSPVALTFFKHRKLIEIYEFTTGLIYAVYELELK